MISLLTSVKSSTAIKPEPKAPGCTCRATSRMSVSSTSIPTDSLKIAGNLLDNAFRYTPEEGTVAVQLRKSSSAVYLEVRDTGPGIDRSDLPHVFERLYVAQRYRPVRAEGSGLGLSIVKELTEAMAGTIDVTSSPGSGTTVTVSLAI